MTKKKWMDALKRAFLKECGDDFVGLWAIPWKIRQMRPRFSEEELRQDTLEIVRFLLEDPQIVAGHPTLDGKFVPWTMDVPSVLQRIENEWRALGRDLDPGDIVWFVRRSDVTLAE
jgi:hypothetical protein